MNAPSPPLPPQPSPTPAPARCTFPQIVGAFTLSVGAVTLMGWLTGIQRLAALGFQGTPLVANAAFALILSGVALLLLKATRHRLRLAAQASTFALGALAVATLGEHATGWNLGIDELLIHDPYNLPPLAPGRMAPNTAAGFLLTAAALWLMSRPDALGRRRPWILGGLGLSVALLGSTALLGYLAGFHGFYSWWQLRAMSLPAALILVLLGVTILSFTFGEMGVRWLLGRWLIGGFAFGLALVIATAVYLRTTTEELAEATARVMHSLEVLPKIRLLGADLEIETISLQDYLLTDNASLRDRTTQALITFRTVFAELRELTASNAEMQPQLDRTEQLINEHEAGIHQLITAHPLGGSSALAMSRLTARATALSAPIRAQLDEIITYKIKLLASRQVAAASLSDRAASILPIEIFLMTLLTLAAILRLNSDAAERGRYVEKLRHSERLKTAILNSLPAEIALLTPAGFIVAVNEPWLRFAREHGATAESRVGIGINYLDVCRQALTSNAPYAAEALTGIQDVLAGTRAEFKLEYPCASPTQTLWYLLHATSLHGGEGGALVAHHDITARKQAEEAFRVANQTLRLMFEQGPMGFIEWDIQFCVRRWNRAAETIFGFNAEEAAGRHASFIIPGTSRLQVDMVMNDLLRQRGGERSTNQNVRKDGIKIHCEWYNTPLVDPHGQLNGVASLVIDVTARKQAEENFRVLNAELEQRVAARTAELEAANANILKLNADLNSRADKLEAVNKELESFSYSVSHDLRAPLRAIDGYARMAIEDFASLLDDHGRRLLHVIGAEAKRMSRLIDDLLAFSRISRQQTEPVAIDMRAMAQEVYGELIKAEAERAVQLDLQTLPEALGTPAMIRQVWVNLISNALKFTGKRPVATIEIGAQLGADGEWVYYVKDNGAGFDMRYVNKLFGVFQRLHNQPDFEGTGVGLALVQRILQRHGGRIWAEAEVDQGACFYFTLPTSARVGEKWAA